MATRLPTVGAAVQALQDKYANAHEKLADIRKSLADPVRAALNSRLRTGRSYQRLVKVSVAGAQRAKNRRSRAQLTVVKNSTGPRLLGSHRSLEGLSKITQQTEEMAKHQFFEEGARPMVAKNHKLTVRLLAKLRKRNPNVPLRAKSKAVENLAEGMAIGETNQTSRGRGHGREQELSR